MKLIITSIYLKIITLTFESNKKLFQAEVRLLKSYSILSMARKKEITAPCHVMAGMSLITFLAKVSLVFFQCGDYRSISVVYLCLETK